MTTANTSLTLVAECKIQGQNSYRDLCTVKIESPNLILSSLLGGVPSKDKPMFQPNGLPGNESLETLWAMEIGNTYSVGHLVNDQLRCLLDRYIDILLDIDSINSTQIEDLFSVGKLTALDSAIVAAKQFTKNFGHYSAPETRIIYWFEHD